MFFEVTGKTQSYDWGKLGLESKVAQLASPNMTGEVSQATPYAELWMGTHPNGPALVKQTQETLKSKLTIENLTSGIHEKYNGDLPFLFKVLSIRKALSIQAHPDKKLAARLHSERPDIYKDPNHKPEMAVALTDFEAFIGFRKLNEIASHLNSYPEFMELVGAAGKEFADQVSSGKAESTLQDDIKSNKQSLKNLFFALQSASQQDIEKCISKLLARIKDSTKDLDLLLKRLDGQFKNDVGTFCAFMLNFVNLKPGQAIFLAANEPHAYLSGDCVECMAASDNVVRSGLTPKYKDVDTLVNMLTYNYGSADSQILTGSVISEHTREYNPPIEEFTIYQTIVKNQSESQKGLDGPSIIIVVEGSGTIKGEGNNVPVVTGSILFVGAKADIEITGDLVLYRAFCTL